MDPVPPRHFPADLVAILEAELAPVTEEIIAAISAEVPAYALPLEGKFGRGVRRGVSEGLARFLDVVGSTEQGGDREVGPGAGREVYVALGRGEVREGRSLEALLAAYRVGARVSWRRLAEAATRHGGLGPDELVRLAEAVFFYIDQISAASAEGYALEQSLAAGERERRLDRLTGLLLDGAPPAALDDAARAAGWRPPETLTAVVAPADQAPALAVRVGSEVLRTVRDDRVWLLLPDLGRPARHAAVARSLAGLGAVVGPAVPWAEAAHSGARVELARIALSEGRLRTEADPVVTEDHLAALLLATDPTLVGDLAARRLAPLAELPPATRARLAETLLWWIALRGERAKVAAALHVHPQTVRYRLGQLRTLFGADLDDPAARFELELVLRAGEVARSARSDDDTTDAGALGETRGRVGVRPARADAPGPPAARV